MPLSSTLVLNFGGAPPEKVAEYLMRIDAAVPELNIFSKFTVTVPKLEGPTPTPLWEVLDRRVKDTELDISIKTRLLNEEYHFLGQVVSQPETVLKQIRNMGNGRIKVLDTYLRTLGLRVHMLPHELQGWVHPGDPLRPPA